ncbi:hypothetical protein ABOM_000423 [Aspergillus bombycis]|uniref:Zn(2)-C6 fungal-type domain-containing protein n=1 Tax=Aspergillus bombycis TaxID=109264 RepID=A0A1F8AHU9_9EURO|nr:hypothetical protein ABOM_000423 [Aspergillus bombycis]OGM51313.1 hypothetical protein ABOM_000423 [Aspergillus bombycis]
MAPGLGPLRRNGRLQACEACRKRKTKCDHSLPICARCRKKNLRCVYAPLPATRGFRPARNYESLLQDKQGKNPPCGLLQSSVVDPPIAAGDRSSAAPGLVITVESSAIENAGVLASLGDRALTSGRQPDQATPDIPCGEGPVLVSHPISPSQLGLGLQVVEFVQRNLSLLRKLVVHLYSIKYLPILPASVLLPAWESLWHLLRDFDGTDEQSKACVVSRISHNSHHPIRIAETASVHDLHQHIGGENLRWETIGNVLVMSSYALLHIHNRDLAAADPDKRELSELRTEFQKVTDMLVELAAPVPVCDELGICFRYNRFLLTYRRSVDNSQAVYSSLAELVSSIYAAGFHRTTPSVGGQLDFMQQWHRRCFAIVYTMDKTIATVLSRPPLMARQYCDMEAPADRNFDGLTATTDMESQCDDSADALGFNGNANCISISFIRLRFLLAVIKEETLELHLGTNTSTTIDKAPELLERLQSIWQSCPRSMKYTSDMWRKPLLGQEILTLLYIYLDFLHSKLLILRPAQQLGAQGYPPSLVLVAQEIITTLLVINEERERVREVTSDISLLFLPYGLPCAEILLLELLHHNSHTSGGRNTYPSLSRAKAIRDVTIFISCLTWVAPPGSTNSKSCKQAQARLEQLLDTVLDPLNGVGDAVPESVALSNLPTLDPNSECSPHLDFSSMLTWDLSGMQWGYAPFV